MNNFLNLLIYNKCIILDISQILLFYNEFNTFNHKIRNLTFRIFLIEQTDNNFIYINIFYYKCFFKSFSHFKS